MNIQYSKAAVKAITAMESKAKHRIRTAIEGIPAGDIKPLSGKSGLFRLRVGNKRIIFSCPNDETITIERIGNRGDIYKGGL
ncbi:MAG: type II toxin-antitoxin system RelE/ParE family toxin [Selenomonadaceae bacterium]|nr:type II toxin-antitoxin system RelE/ParE family toxin [Selenomonadaceae bacterium]